MPARQSPPAEPFAVAVLPSPLGPICAAAVAAGIVGVELRASPDAFAFGVTRRTGRPAAGGSGRVAGDGLPAARHHLEVLAAELDRFFAGSRTPVDGPVVFEGMSAWDRRVLEGVRAIPLGETAGYGEVARLIGAAGAARAVGSAVGRNPLALVVPCHRVIAGDGTLGGYGGSWPMDVEAALQLKEDLLELEGVHVARRAGPGRRG